MQTIETQKEAKRNYIKPKFSFSCFKGKFRGGNHSQIQSIQLITTIVFCLFLALVVVVLSTFVRDHIRKFMASEDYIFLPQHTNLCCSAAPGLDNSKQLRHSMSDEELMWGASMVPRVSKYPFDRTPKVAFMFLVRERIPLVPFWETFFKGHEGMFSIYVHTSMGKGGDEPPQSSVFHKRSVPSKPFEWGKATTMDAERRLLANALLDFSNERFILVSETCIPLFNFSTIYNHLIINEHSHTGSFHDPTRVGRGRYGKKIPPTISLLGCRKGFQWFEVERRLAIEIVSDTIYFPTLKEHCHATCSMDENYLANLAKNLAKD